MEIVLASGNRHKHAEFSDFFASHAEFSAHDIRLICLDDVPDTLRALEETGSTYEENALIKATAWADYTHLPAIADDSGIEVRALGWRPGIHSARAVPGSDADRTNWLLRELQGVSDRKACFVASLVIAPPGMSLAGSAGREYFVATGRCWGTIAHEVRGENGFGYDPVFLPDGYERTFGELPPSVKSKISHRAIAVQGVAQMVPSMLKYLSVRGRNNEVHDVSRGCTGK